jgi:hypothetical protein
MKDVGIFYGHLVYLMDIWFILWPFGLFNVHLVYFMAIWYTPWSFGILRGHLVYFSPFWYVSPRKIWQPWTGLALYDKIEFFGAMTNGTGLPDGIFSNQKSKFGSILEGLEMEDVGIFYLHMVIWNILCRLVWFVFIWQCCDNLVHFSPFWYNV